MEREIKKNKIKGIKNIRTMCQIKKEYMVSGFKKVDEKHKIKKMTKIYTFEGQIREVFE